MGVGHKTAPQRPWATAVALRSRALLLRSTMMSLNSQQSRRLLPYIVYGVFEVMGVGHKTAPQRPWATALALCSRALLLRSTMMSINSQQCRCSLPYKSPV